jgi:hypothetical protein
LSGNYSTIITSFNNTKQFSLSLSPLSIFEGGVQIGNVAVCDWTAVYVGDSKGEASSCWSVGQTMKGLAKAGHEIDITLDQIEPWATFAKKLIGSGQMESRTFEASFPEDHASAKLKGAICRFTVVTKKIMKKVEVTREEGSENMSEVEKKAKLERAINTVHKAKYNAALDVVIKDEVMSFCELDTDNVVNSVSWAKFGEKSLAAFCWQLVKEKIAKNEKCEVKDVPALLRAYAQIV